MKTKALMSAVVVLFSMTLASEAEAKEVRVQAFDCKTFGGIPRDYNFALENDSKTETMHVLCPIQDTSSFPKAQITKLNIHGRNHKDDSIKAQLCVSAWSTTSGYCSGTHYFDNPGDVTYEVIYDKFSSFKIWTQVNANDFGYIHLTLPKRAADGSRAAFRGYYFSDAGG